MARVGGRNTVFSWFVGIVCAGVVVALAVLALPMIPHAGGWIASGLGTLTGTKGAETPAPEDRDVAPTPAGATRECRDLYPDVLWTTLRIAEGSELTASVDPPTLSATALVEALAPAPTATCAWRSNEGAITTTVATAPPDAAAIAEPALAAAGFACAAVDGRVRCTREAEGVVETLETGGGLWLSSVEEGWHPAGYAARTAERVWG